MKKTFRILSLAAGMLAMGVALHAQKFGHITSEELLQIMPEYDSALVKLQKLQKQYELDIEGMQVEINKKIDDFSTNETTMSNLIKETKAAEIQDLQVRLQNFTQRAQQDLQQQNMVLIQPIMDKARTAINAVAKEKGLIYVFDLSQGNPVYTSPESLDMMPLVRAKLGL
ncbi:MAG: OmpH family outer membrane protein [Bacteroidales bacterium]